VLAQRNALLRQGTPPGVVAAWDDGLVEWGSRVIATRAQWVAERDASFRRHVSHIASGSTAVLEYDGTVRAQAESGEPLGTDEIAAEFARELERVREREARRGMTVVGPHRDDLRIRAPGEEGSAWVDLRVFGSGGQQRTAAVALRMVEAESLTRAFGADPIILLDDVFAELDPGRSERILEWVEKEEGGQVILTAPKPSDFQVRGGSLARWTIRDGVVRPL